MFYSKTTGGFYSQEMHGDHMPADAVAITPAQHAALLAGQAQGQRIVAGEGGAPVLAAPPALTLGDLQSAKNGEINAARAAANTGTFAHGGKAFSCDQLSRSDIDGVNGYVAIYDALPPAFPGAWKAADNSWTPIADVEAWKTFYSAMVAQGAANFAHAQELKTRLAAAATAKDIAAIAW